MANKKLWGGRFKKEMNPLLKCFSYSLKTDQVLLDSELDVNEAWAGMLVKIKLIPPAEGKKILRGLKALRRKLTSQDISALYLQHEDIHSLIQSLLEKEIGPTAKKLHTGRSRNDLVVTSTRIYLKRCSSEILQGLSDVQRALVHLARRAGRLVVAGMTHLRMAQPVLMAHHLLAYVEMLEEDNARIIDAQKRLDILSLGSAALAGSSLPLDQKFLAKKLGFSKIASNSMAAVSDRSFMTELLSTLAILWMHLSRLSEDFILWNSEAFHYIELDDAYATGSSLMPQKKNPDIFELIRGRSAVISGALSAHLGMQKGLALAYNRDLQEDKPGVFDAVIQTKMALALLSGVLKTTTFHPESIELSVQEDSLYATDLLEYLVRRKVAFSDAHQIVGKAIRFAAENEIPLRELPLKQWKKFSSVCDQDLYDLFDPNVSIGEKRTVGSTHPRRVQAEINKWQRLLTKKRP